MLRGEGGNPFLHLTTKGKNDAFYNAIGDALLLDTLEKPITWPSIKRACTPKAIRKIHEAIPEIWPSENDLYRIYESEKVHNNGLYIGKYDVHSIFKGLTRHSIYSDRILLFDPFLDPRTLRPEFNPVEKPERYGINTLQNLLLWIELKPWIDSGLIGFIKKPEDFNSRLSAEAWAYEKAVFSRNPELTKLLDESVNNSLVGKDYDDLKRFRVLSMSDEQIAEFFRADNPDADYFQLQSFLKKVHEERLEHPYFIDFKSEKSPFTNQVITMTTGTAYYIAKMVASATNSHIITDIAPRWKEIELDRLQNNVQLGAWTDFAKAFQNSNLPVLDNIPLNAALLLRKENRLSNMRSFLRKLWKSAHSSDLFHEENSIALTDELKERIAEADDEWRKINSNLATLLSVEGGGTLMASAGGIVNGNTGLFVGGAALTGLGTVAADWYRRRNFPNRYPASFFLGIK
jgi:hypothetical protein